MLESPFDKTTDLKPCNCIKKGLQHRCSLVKIAKFLRTPYFEKHLQMAASALEPLLFLICFNEFFDNLSFNLKPFTDATSLFSFVHNINQLG